MNYRSDKYGNEISVLGYGCMRFKRSGGKIDLEKAEREIMAAYNGGVNYFDTAYIYPGSEAALGEIVERNGIRDKINIATKLPHYLIKTENDAEKYFKEQLSRLRTDRIDYYLMHMLTDIDTWGRLKELGVDRWLDEKKRSGEVKQVGFSYHGGPEMFCRLVDAYDWDFCMIQYNYMDENSQAGRRGLKYASSKGLPVMIMEPLRGGRLVNGLPDGAKKIFAFYEKQYTPAQWSFKWLWDQPEVTCVLSGMNSEEAVIENIKTASESYAGELTEADAEMLKRVVAEINSKMKVGCTGCGYCTPCPKNVDIPGCFAAYNRRFSDGWFTSEKEYFMCTALRQTSSAASNCVGCGKCKQHCPQGIDIPNELKNVSAKLEGPVYKIARKAVKLFRTY